RALDDKQRQLIVAQLDTDTAKLEQRYYQTGEYQELAVRQKLGLALPGEKVLILPPNSQKVLDSDKQSAQASLPEPEPISNFNQWRNFLFSGRTNNLSP